MRLILRFWNPNQRHFVLILRQVPVHAVVTRIDLSADKPLPERRIARVERGVPILIPGQQIGILLKAFGKFSALNRLYIPGSVMFA